MAEAVNPWRRLRELPEVELRWAYIDDALGFYLPNGDGTGTIVLDADLDYAERRATLLHELIHHERGICGIDRYDERGIEDAVALQLVPVAELAALYQVAVANDLPVEPWMVAEKFSVPDDVAERAMLLFLRTAAA